MSSPVSRGHRKSHSTSALALLGGSHSPVPSLAKTSLLPPMPPMPASSGSMSAEDGALRLPARHRPSHLPAVREHGREGGEGGDVSRVVKEHLSGKIDRRTVVKGKCASSPDRSGSSKRRLAPVDEVDSRDEELQGWVNDVRSLRSSSRRRLAALSGLERALVQGCLDSRSEGPMWLRGLLSLEVHTHLLALVSRHTSTLSHRSRSTAIPPGDELALALVPELSVVFGILQGLCLISRSCKEAVGEVWAMEMFIDLLLLLRAQPAISETDKPIAYIMMELLFCVLVDSSRYARRFERLSGLEAVVRVLKGTGVPKDVRMKCIEFLYFYLLPEPKEASRAVSTSSTSSSSSTGSQLFPPSPVSQSVSPSHLSPAKVRRDSQPGHHLADVDMPFVPMTPRKPPQPNLGYLTPATRKPSGTSASSTPSLAPVPGSPRLINSGTSRGLAAMLDECDGSGSGPGLGSLADTPRSSRTNRSFGEESDRSGVGLGLGLPKKSSGIVRSSTVQRDLARAYTTKAGDQSTSSLTSTSALDLTADSHSTRSHSGSSGSSTVMPPSRSVSRSSTQASSNDRPSGLLDRADVANGRRSSIRRVSQSPLIQSSIPEPAVQASVASVSRPAKIRHSRTQSHMSALAGVLPPADRRKIPQDYANASHLVAAAPGTISHGASLTSQTPESGRAPSRSRGFPASLTKGLPSSASSPALSKEAVPLGATKRVPSDRHDRSGMSGSKEREKPVEVRKGIKSVEEKKEMLGLWLGNVDQLVQGVEKSGRSGRRKSL